VIGLASQRGKWNDGSFIGSFDDVQDCAAIVARRSVTVNFAV
jgi:hypothetical protein